MIALYRMVGTSSAAPSSFVWPLRNVQPGQPLQVGTGDTAVSVPTGGGGFYVFATGTQDAFSAVMSTRAVCNAWAYPLTVCVVRAPQGEWHTHLPAEVARCLHWISSSDLGDLGIDQVPVVAFARDGRVVDAAAGLLSPAGIMSFFELVARPRHDGTHSSPRRRDTRVAPDALNSQEALR